MCSSRLPESCKFDLVSETLPSLFGQFSLKPTADEPERASVRFSRKKPDASAFRLRYWLP